MPQRGSRSDPKRVSEKDFSRVLMETLATFRYKAMHVYPLQTVNGWRTPTTSPGYIDITAIRLEFILAIEAKGYNARGDKGTPVTSQQIGWLEAFASIPTGRAWVLRPTDDFDVFVSWLRFPAEAPRRFGYAIPQGASTLR